MSVQCRHTQQLFNLASSETHFCSKILQLHATILLLLNIESNVCIKIVACIPVSCKSTYT